jgi:predicted metal-dependent peptidase
MESTQRRYERLREEHDHSTDMAAPTIDNHIWEEARDDLAAAQELLAGVLEQAALEAGEVPPELRRGLQALGVGTVPGGAVYAVGGGRQGHIDWRRLLRRYIGQSLRQQPAYNWPPRRCPELVGILPGQRRVGAQPSVVAIIDTSGSITAESLEQISGELRRLSRSHPVHVVEADSAVQRVYRYRGPLQLVRGRGGTDFRPALERSLLAPLRPAVILFFTDGLGEAPQKAPPWPLIWCLTPEGEPPAQWGGVVKMEPDRTK